MAYERRCPVSEIAGRFRKRPEAITEQLRRTSKAVERRLLLELVPKTLSQAIEARTADPGAARGVARRALEVFLTGREETEA
jgi:hypothetical protein